MELNKFTIIHTVHCYAHITYALALFIGEESLSESLQAPAALFRSLVLAWRFVGLQVGGGSRKLIYHSIELLQTNLVCDGKLSVLEGAESVYSRHAAMML